MSELVRYEIKSATAILTLNRADKRNALSRKLIGAIADAFEEAHGDENVRCIILTAAGPSFCAGMDLAELQESLERVTAARQPIDIVSIWDDAHRLAKLYDQVYSCTKPTIAAVQGSAVAGGCGLVTACDMAISVPEAKFGYPEVRRGLVAAMVMPHLLRHVGERMARYLLLTGELIDATTALSAGLLNEIVPAERLLERAMAISKSCIEGGPQALAKTKDFLQDFSRQALSIEKAAEGSAAPRLSEECQEGLRAFFDKKPAPWIP
jgi:methylglutaconyl-CoA hydratase